MSEHVQMAKSQCGLTVQPQASDGLEAWHRSLPWWDLYFAVVAIGTVAVVWPDPVAVGLLTIMISWYLIAGRRSLNSSTDRRGLWYLGVAGVLLVAAVIAESGASYILFALSPQAHMALRFSRATVATVLINLVPTAVLFARSGTVLPTLPIAVLAIVLTTIIGFSIDRLIEQSMQLAQSRAEVARLSQIAERQRIAGDLHDTIAQGLSSLVMLVQAAEASLDRDKRETRRHLEMAARTARENLHEVRAVLDALMPEHQGLPEALQRLISRFAEETGIPAVIAVTGEPRVLPTALEVVLLRAAQESLHNARRHAKASSVKLRLSFQPDFIGLEVSDDGRGFDPAKGTKGYGLKGMRSRVAQVGGELVVDAATTGTAIRIAVPA